jgi:hypothetical protein
MFRKNIGSTPIFLNEPGEYKRCGQPQNSLYKKERESRPADPAEKVWTSIENIGIHVNLLKFGEEARPVPGLDGLCGLRFGRSVQSATE